MSLANEVQAVREKLLARMRELEPLVAEYEELRRLAASMGLSGELPAAPATPAAPGAPAMASTTARDTSPLPAQDTSTEPRAERAPRPSKGGARHARERGDGELAARIMQAVRDDPGHTVADYATVLGAPPTALYRPVRRLTTDGSIVKRARQLFPAG